MSLMSTHTATINPETAASAAARATQSMSERWGFMRGFRVAHPATAHRRCHMSAPSEKVGGILAQVVVQGHAGRTWA